MNVKILALFTLAIIVILSWKEMKKSHFNIKDLNKFKRLNDPHISSREVNSTLYYLQNVCKGTCNGETQCALDCMLKYPTM